MLLAVVLWAINFSFIKIALREFSPLGFNGIRLSLASLVLLLILLFKGEGFSVRRQDRWKLLVLGIIGNTVYQLLFIHGLNLTTASNTAIIIALTPAFIALLSFYLRHERLNWTAWSGIIISFVGFYFVITKQAGTFHFSSQSIKGDLMILAGCLFWTIYTVYSKPLLDRISPLKLTAVTMFYGTVFYLPFCLRDMTTLPYSELSLKAWLALIYSALFALAICYVIWYASVRRVGNSKTAIYDYLIPVFSVLFATVFLNERISFLQGVGALIIFMGVYLARSGYRLFNSKKGFLLADKIKKI